MINKELIVSVVTYNSEKFIKKFLISILSNNILAEKIVVFDNNSTDHTLDIVAEVSKEIKIIRSKKNLGYAKSINRIFKKTNFKYILVCNADIEFKNNSIQKLYNEIKLSDDIGCIGPQQYYPNKKWQKSGGDFPSFKEIIKNFFLINLMYKIIKQKYLKKNFKIRLFPDYLDGAAMLINRKKFDLVGGFDKNYFFYTEEVDFFFKLRNKNIKYYIFTPSKIIHYRGGHSINKKFDNDKKFIKYKMLSRRYFIKKFRNNFYGKILILSEILYFLFYSAFFCVLSVFSKRFHYNNLYFRYSAKVLLDEIKK